MVSTKVGTRNVENNLWKNRGDTLKSKNKFSISCLWTEVDKEIEKRLRYFNPCKYNKKDDFFFKGKNQREQQP